MYLYKYIIISYVMLNYPVPNIIKYQVKLIIWSKGGHNAHFWPPYINLKPNLEDTMKTISTFLSCLV